MKNLLAISLVFGGIALGVSIYSSQWITPSVEAYERLLPQMDLDSELYANTRDSWLEEKQKEEALSMIAMITGAFGLLGGVFSGLFFDCSNRLLGWLAAVVSLIGLLLGMLSGTHLFS